MYLIDANVLIEAKNRYYAFDIAPGFWTWLDHAQDESLACSIDAVRQELRAGDDELSQWAQEHPKFFRPMDTETVAQFGDLTTWAQGRQYNQAALNAFTGNDADYLLVAHGRAHGHTVVTHETPKPNAKKRVIIPDACLAMGVEYVNTFTMLRKTNARFDLSTT